MSALRALATNASRGPQLSVPSSNKYTQFFVSSHEINKEILRSAENITHLILVLRGYCKRSNFNELNGKNLAVAFHRLKKLSNRRKYLKLSESREKEVLCETQTFFEHLTRAAMRRHYREFRPRDVSNILWSLTAMEASEASRRMYSKFSDFALLQRSSFNAQELSNIAISFAHSKIENAAVFGMIASQAKLIIDTFESQTVANVIWAFSKQRLPEHLYDTLLDSILSSEEILNKKFRAQEISNILYAFASTSQRPRQWRALVLHLLPQVKHAIEDFKAQEVANVMWAMAKLGVKTAEPVQLLCAQASARLDSFNSKDFANVLWALAKMKVRAEALISDMLTRAQTQLTHFSAQELSNVIYAIAVLAVENKEFVACWSRVAHEKRKSFNAQEIANIIWSLSVLEVADIGLIHGLQSAGLERLDEFNAQECSNVVYALGRLKIPSEEFVRALNGVAVRRFRENSSQFKCQGISMLFYGNARLSVYDKELLKTFYKHIIQHAKDFSTESVCALMWAFAHMGFFERRVLDALASRVLSMDVKKLKKEQLDQISYCFSAAGVSGAHSLIRTRHAVEEVRALQKAR